MPKSQFNKNNQIHSNESFNTKELLILLNNSVPTLQNYFEKCFPDLIFKWKEIYTFHRILTINDQLHVYQYQILNNAFYLLIFKKRDAKLRSFCYLEDDKYFANCFKNKT